MSRHGAVGGVVAAGPPGEVARKATTTARYLLEELNSKRETAAPQRGTGARERAWAAN